jgi:Transcriptional regulator PadR-like family
MLPAGPVATAMALRPALVAGRLMRAGLISDHWEDPSPADRPPRRFYEMTGAGRAAYRDAVAARAARRAAWAWPAPQGGETA